MFEKPFSQCVITRYSAREMPVVTAREARQSFGEAGWIVGCQQTVVSS